ncbi:MAG: hypothetical protein AB8F78_17265 [Saprospiraceae bacterium]
MNRLHIASLLLVSVLGTLALPGCEPDPVANPYGSTQGTTDTTSAAMLDYTGLAGLQDQVFRPTCANSGCHDGTFEPDFRTLGSTYNTLVNHPVIKNDAANTFSFRVVPGSVTTSQLMNRLTVDIDNNSGIMPLALEPDSDYPANKEVYLEWVRRWITEGAKIEE